jgi:hypothetical protein
MSTKAEITTSIDDNIRNKTPKVLKVEHADTEQLITDEMFPDSVKVEWNGTTSIDPTTDIICSGSLSSSDFVKFIVYFWKQGNDVYYNGYVESLNPSSALGDLLLIEFDTTLYKTLAESSVKTIIISSNNQVGKSIIFIKDTGLYLTSGLPTNVTSIPTKWYFNGNYKVQN